MHNFVYLVQRRSQEFSCEPNFASESNETQILQLTIFGRENLKPSYYRKFESTVQIKPKSA